MELNTVLKKVTIAMNLRNEDVREIFHLGGEELSTSQTGALLVNASNKNFKLLSEERLEVFFNGLILYSRGPKENPNAMPMALINLIYLLGEKGQLEALESLRELTSDVLAQVEEQL